ncbi:ATP-grasp domain-containing protein [Coraliomargarita parva]|uniref:ATP-grasp domain-containing protein n=1 Tax=Coraliomargarita parva TaxID=3014050 RepID=UPI0022B2D008|nr:ATP-grasp domain-containing protein [Coraliomargarita parva]
MPTPPRKPCVLLVYGQYSSSFTAYPWMLAKDGRLTVDVLTRPDHTVRHSVWIRKVHYFESITDVVASLKACLSEESYEMVLYMDEPARAQLLTHRNDPILEPHLPFPANSALNQAVDDKQLFYRWCAQHEIPIPRSIEVKQPDDIRPAVEKIGYPCMLKAAVGSGGKGIHLFLNAEELEDYLREAHTDTGPWVAQEYIDGPVGSVSMACKKGKVYGMCSSAKHVSLSGGLGPSAIRRLIHDPALDAIARRVAEAGHITGITGFDWMQVGPGQYRVIDPHLGRCTTSCVVASQDGVEMGRAIHSALTGGVPEPVSRGSGRIIWMMPQTIELIFQGRFFLAWSKASLFRKNTSIFWCGQGEWRMLLRLMGAYLVAQMRILGGRLRGRH